MPVFSRTSLLIVTVLIYGSIGLPLDFVNNVDIEGESSPLSAGSKYDVNDAYETGDRILREPVTRSSRATTSVAPTAKILVSVMRRSTRNWEPWQLNHNICPPSLCTASDESRPRGTGGSVFYNGDIVLDADSEKIIYKNTIRRRWKRATSRNSRLWPDGIVPYVFGDIADKSKRVIKKAMKAIEANTCVRFRPKKLRDEDYIRYISESGCWSNVGRVGGEQKTNIGPGCERLGTAIHEIAHSLGFWHEQGRPDRDQYVEILPDNISPRYLPDFEKADKKLVSSRGFPYDYESVMHYSKKAFTNLGEVTIKVIGIGKKLNMTIGQREQLSILDIAQLRDMYNCHDKEDNNVTLCPKDWLKKGRSCYKFEPKAREQFAGAQRHCEKLNSRLLSIETERENKLIKKYAKKKYPDVTTWRTGGRVVNGTFKWYKGEKSSLVDMDYTNWNKGHPSTYSSMALVFNKTKDRVKWEGVWLGSASQMPNHAYAVICERRARRKCIPGKFKDGRDYRGKLDHTIDGILCQKWNSQYPHSHKLLPPGSKAAVDGIGDHNYCRNPSKDRKSRPWCFTNKSNFKWQYCDVTICSGSAMKVKPDKGQPNKDKGNSNGSKKASGNKNGSKKDRNTNTVDTKPNAGNNRGGSNKNGSNKNSKSRNELSNGNRNQNTVNNRRNPNDSPGSTNIQDSSTSGKYTNRRKHNKKDRKTNKNRRRPKTTTRRQSKGGKNGRNKP